MRILALPSLYLVYKGLTSAIVSPITPAAPKNGNGLGLNGGLTEQQKQQQREREDARRKAEADSVAQQKERDRIAAEEKARLDNEWLKRQAEIKKNPPDCRSGYRAELRGVGTKNFPYYWVCVLVGF